MPIRVSETCQNISGHVKCPCMVIRRTCPFLQLATRLTEVTRRHAPSRHRSRQCISCWRAARCSWSRSLIPRVRACRCWAILRGFLRRDTIARQAAWVAIGDGYAVVTRRDAVFPILQRLMDAVQIGFYAQC